MLDFFFPQQLEKVPSKINGEITVVKQNGKINLYVSGTQQSGDWEEKIWSKAISNLHQFAANSHKYKILILGLGAGALVKDLIKNFPDSNITGVEIDPVMIDLGEKYFGLSDLSNLRVLRSDAENFIIRTTEKFDLIFVDLFLGQNTPQQFESKDFLRKLSQTTSKDGLVIFNRLATKTADFVPEKFIDKLLKFFKIEKSLKVDFNNIIFAKAKTN